MANHHPDSHHEPTLAERIIRIEMQLDRLIADAESEKGTRARINQEIFRRLSMQERTLCFGAGAVAALQLVGFFLNH